MILCPKIEGYRDMPPRPTLGKKSIKPQRPPAAPANQDLGTPDRALVNLFPLRRRLAAVLLADVVGYSRMMSVDEEGTHRRIDMYFRAVIDPTLTEYRGRLVRSMGDSILAEFDSALDALRCGLDIQERLTDRQHNISGEKIQLRIGLNTGDVIVDDRDIYGHSINVTARLETLAGAGTVYVSQSIYDQTRGQSNIGFIDRGSHRVKNIDYPIRVFEARYGHATPAFRRRVSIKHIGMAAAGLIGIAAVGVFVTEGTRNEVQDNSIIVLPFRDLNGSADGEYFADAITDDLTTDLSRLRQSFVISSATAMTLKGKAADARVIGKQFGVRYMLEGTIRRSHTAVQINVQFVDTRTGAGVWAERFVHEDTKLSGLEEAITSRIGASLRIPVKQAKKHSPVGSFAADYNPLDRRLRAMALIIGKPSPEKYLAARTHAEEAVKADPNSADGWAILARVLVSEYLTDWNNVGLDGVARAEAAYKQALAIDPLNTHAHMAAGNVLHTRGDIPGALAEFEKVIEIDPNFTNAYAQKARALLQLGRNTEAAAALQRAIRLSPADPFIGFFYWGLGRIAFSEGKYAEAIDWLEKSVQEGQNYWYNRAFLISAYVFMGRIADSAAQLHEFKRKFPEHTLTRIREISQKGQFKNNVSTKNFENLLRGLEQAGLD